MAPIRLAIIATVGGGLCAVKANVAGELLLLQQVSRHGHRSPKTDFFDECPADPFTVQYDTWNAGLTGPGYAQTAAIGTLTKSMYGEWLGRYNASQMTVRGCDSDRVLQSSEIAMFHLFSGSAPELWMPGKSGTFTFVPIHTMPEEEDNLLTVEAASCKARSKADYNSWWDSIGADILRAGKAVADPVTAYCGREATTNKVLKDQIDGIGFDFTQDFPVNGLSADELLAAQNLTIVLQRGAFATDEARTYMAGDLPATLLANLDRAISMDGSDQPDQKFSAYFSHRHALMGLAEFLGFSWKQYGAPEGTVQTGTTIWIELRRGAGAGQYDVAFLRWVPNCDKKKMTDCPVEPVELPGCKRGTVCSIEEFRAIVSERVARTGTWQMLCGAEVVV